MQARQIGIGPLRQRRDRLHLRGNQHNVRRPDLGNGSQHLLGIERGQQCNGAAEMQCRQGLNVDTTDMEERQHAHDMIIRSQTMHVLAVECIPANDILIEHRTLRPARRARGVNDQ